MSLATRLFGLTVCLCICWPSAGNAQGAFPFEPGFVVTAAGDTLQGEVQRQLDLDLAHGAVFRMEGESGSRRYVAADIAGFGFHDGAHFVRKDLSPGPDHPESRPLFLQRLAEGEVSLYAFAFEQARLEGGHLDTELTMPEDRFAVERDGRVTAVYEARRMINDEATGERRMSIDRQYRRAMAAAFSGCPGEQERTVRLRYTRRDLIRSVERYHDCVNQEVFVVDRGAQARRSAQVVEYEVRLWAGPRTLTQHRENYVRYPAREIEEPGRGTIVALEGRAAARLHAISSQLSIPISVSLARSFVDGSWEFPEPPFLVREYFEPSDFERFAVGGGLGLRFDLPTEGWTPYLEGGVRIAYFLGDKRTIGTGVDGRIQFVSGESGWHVEAGAKPGLAGPLSAFSVGLRYETMGMGQFNPFYASSRSTWSNSSFLLSLGMGL